MEHLFQKPTNHYKNKIYIYVLGEILKNKVMIKSPLLDITENPNPARYFCGGVSFSMNL